MDMGNLPLVSSGGRAGSELWVRSLAERFQAFTSVARGPWRGRWTGLEEDLAELFSEVGRDLVLVAAGDPHEPAQVGLELVLIRAGRAPFQVQLQLEDLGVVQLSVDVPVELLLTVVAVHVWGTSRAPLPWTIPDSTA